MSQARRLEAGGRVGKVAARRDMDSDVEEIARFLRQGQLRSGMEHDPSVAGRCSSRWVREKRRAGCSGPHGPSVGEGSLLARGKSICMRRLPAAEIDGAGFFVFGQQALCKATSLDQSGKRVNYADLR